MSSRDATGQATLSASGSPDASSPQISVIVPTYREAENLPLLVPRIAAALRDAGLNFEVIVVDDNSPDTTVAACAALASEFPLRLEVRTTDRGLSSAVLHGMRLAKGTTFVVMDADLSHPPEKIPELVIRLADGDTDFVIGSRYVPGGKADDDWGMARWINSKIATVLAWPLTSARDPMAGFFALRRETFLKAERPNPIGYKIGLELIVKCHCRSVNEVPIHFSDRVHGESKLTWGERFNYLRHLKRLYEFQLARFSPSTRFVLVGSTGMLFDFVLFSIFLASSLPLGVSRGLAIFLALLWNSWLHGQLARTTAISAQEQVGPESDNSSEATSGGSQSVFRYVVFFTFACLLGGVINWSLSVWLCDTYAFFNQYKLLAAGLGVATGAIPNYVLVRCFALKAVSP